MLWGCSELATGQNVGPVTIHLSQSSEWVQAPERLSLATEHAWSQRR